jgi:ACS family D-galactonate transporter-like MFS transporter
VDATITPKQHARPTRVRYGLLLLMFLITAVNYLDRTNLSIAAPHIKQEFGISATDERMLLSAFSWAYVLAQMPGGWLHSRLARDVRDQRRSRSRGRGLMVPQDA